MAGSWRRDPGAVPPRPARSARPRHPLGQHAAGRQGEAHGLRFRGVRDHALLSSAPRETSQYYADGARAIIHLEQAPANGEFPGWNSTAASTNQHHYTKYLVQPENGFQAHTVAVTHLWEEPSGTHSGRH